VLGLKWVDVDFIDKSMNVLRSFVDGAIGPCKTEISQQAVPLDEIAVEGLLAWRKVCPFGYDENWVFASERTLGKLPVWPDSLRTKILQPAAKKVGITKRVGWHTFRHTYSTLLKANGEYVKVVQELMRHANITTTMNIYTRALTPAKWQAQPRRWMCCSIAHRNRWRCSETASVPILFPRTGHLFPDFAVSC
jgi:integrase